MADPKRHESSPASEAADRDSRAEALLVDGLDRYFAGQFEEAIHLWTRVLFLDRSHARARAYIDRARTALAERQRQADEMLHATGELLASGRTAEARDLLRAAVATSGDDEHAAAMHSRLERLERARAGQRGSGRSTAAGLVPAAGRWSWSRTALSAAVAAIVVVLALLIGSATVRDWLGGGVTPQTLPAVGRAPLLPVLSSSEAALVRARTLFSRGRLADALQVLDRVNPESANRPAADRLRVEIQQMLLATRPALSPTPADLTRGRP